MNKLIFKTAAKTITKTIAAASLLCLTVAGCSLSSSKDEAGPLNGGFAKELPGMDVMVGTFQADGVHVAAPELYCGGRKLDTDALPGTRMQFVTREKRSTPEGGVNSGKSVVETTYESMDYNLKKVVINESFTYVNMLGEDSLSRKQRRDCKFKAGMESLQYSSDCESLETSSLGDPDFKKRGEVYKYSVSSSGGDDVLAETGTFTYADGKTVQALRVTTTKLSGRLSRQAVDRNNQYVVGSSDYDAGAGSMVKTVIVTKDRNGGGMELCDGYREIFQGTEVRDGAGGVLEATGRELTVLTPPAKAQQVKVDSLVGSASEPCALTNLGVICWRKVFGDVISNLNKLAEASDIVDLTRSIDGHLYVLTRSKGLLLANGEPSDHPTPKLKHPRAMSGVPNQMFVADDSGIHVWGDKNLTIPLSEPVLQLKAAGAQVCAVLASHQLRCWQLQDGDKALESPIPGLPAAASEIAMDYRAACAINAGKVSCWSSSADLTPPSDLVNPRGLSVGSEVLACAATDFGVRCWGPAAAALPEPPTELTHPYLTFAPTSTAVCAAGDRGVSCWTSAPKYDEARYFAEELPWILRPH